MDDRAILWVVLVAVAYVGLMTFMVTRSVIVYNERELACVAAGYEGYDGSYEACKSGEIPVMLYPYEGALGRE